MYLHRAARERLERTNRETERAARDAYLGVLSEISRVRASKQALESSRTALQATEAGFEVGTRTTVDVLDRAGNCSTRRPTTRAAATTTSSTCSSCSWPPARSTAPTWRRSTRS